MAAPGQRQKLRSRSSLLLGAVAATAALAALVVVHRTHSLSRCFCAEKPLLGAIAAEKGGQSRVLRAATGTFEGKVAATLGPYRDKAIVVEGVPRPDVEDAAIDAAFQKKKAKKTEFVRINFTGSGARLGLTVIIDFEGKRGAGHPERGMPIPGTKMTGHQLELKEDQPEPWRQFVQAIVAKGMGQMEQKTFAVTFPNDYRKADFAGSTVDFTVLVHEIGETRPVTPDPRPDAEQRQEIAAQLQSGSEKKSWEVVDAKLREALLQSCQVDTDAKTKNVAWAKFGVESEKAMRWNFILEEVARAEGIPFTEVMPFLRSQADVRYVAA